MAGNAAPTPDYRVVWHDIGMRILNGTDLYLQGTGDNKPPLFYIFNVLSAATGAHFIAWKFSVGITNSLIGASVYRWARSNNVVTGVIASSFVLLIMPLVDGYSIQPGSYAVLFILVAVLVDHPFWRGASVAVAVLFYQYVFAAVLVFAIFELFQAPEQRFHRFASYCAGGVVATVGIFVLIALIWSVDSTLAAFYWTFGFPEQFASAPPTGIPTPTNYMQNSWLVSDPVKWIFVAGYTIRVLLPLLPVAAIAVYAVQSDNVGAQQANIIKISAILGVAMLVPYLVKSFRDYAVLLLPFYATLASIGISHLTHVIESDRARQ